MTSDPDKTLVDWAVSDLAHFGDLTREEAALLLPMWSQMRRLRVRSDAAADEVTALVLSRFAPAEPPSVPGLDFLPGVVADAASIVAESLTEPFIAGQVITSDMLPMIERAREMFPGEVLGATQMNAAKASIVAESLTEPRRWRDRDGKVWREDTHGRIALVVAGDAPGVLWHFSDVELQWGPLVEVRPDAEPKHGFTPHGHPCCAQAVGDGPDLRARCNAMLGCVSCQAAAAAIHGQVQP